MMVQRTQMRVYYGTDMETSAIDNQSRATPDSVPSVPSVVLIFRAFRVFRGSNGAAP
jgi:hypothetical protein